MVLGDFTHNLASERSFTPLGPGQAHIVPLISIYCMLILHATGAVRVWHAWPSGGLTFHRLRSTLCSSFSFWRAFLRFSSSSSASIFFSRSVFPALATMSSFSIYKRKHYKDKIRQTRRPDLVQSKVMTWPWSVKRLGIRTYYYCYYDQLGQADTNRLIYNNLFHRFF